VIELIEIEPHGDARRFITGFPNDRNVAQFILKDDVMYIWGGRGDWVKFDEEYKIIKS